MIKFSKNLMLDYNFINIETIKIFTQEDLPRGKRLNKPIWDKIIKNEDTEIISEFLNDASKIISDYITNKNTVLIKNCMFLDKRKYSNCNTEGIVNIGKKEISFTGISDLRKNHSVDLPHFIHSCLQVPSFHYGKNIPWRGNLLVNIEHWLDKRKFELMENEWKSWKSNNSNGYGDNPLWYKAHPIKRIIPYHVQRHAMSGKHRNFHELVGWYCTAKKSERNKVMGIVRKYDEY